MYGLDWNDPYYLGQTRGNLGKERVDIACQNEIHEVIIKYIWGTVMILNLQLKIKSVNKFAGNYGQETIKAYNLIFA